MVRWRQILALLIFCGSALAAAAADLTVFAAASLKTALDEIAADFTGLTDQGVVMSYAGTPVLARQIAQGAPADVVLAASTQWMGWLDTRGAIRPESRFDMVHNRMVLVAHGAAPPLPDLAPQTLRARLGPSRIAMALVDAVPAGIYGKAALSHMGLWAQIAPQVAQTDNARAALSLVASGAVPFGIVYVTDARADPRVSVLAVFPDTSHPPIIYPAARVAGRSHPATQAFLDHLRSDAANEIFRAHGFAPPRGRP